jgi:hypothetical protein
MKAREGLTKPSEPDKVGAYMNNLKHPLAGVAQTLREVILKTDPVLFDYRPSRSQIGFTICWNTPGDSFLLVKPIIMQKIEQNCPSENSQSPR